MSTPASSTTPMSTPASPAAPTPAAPGALPLIGHALQLARRPLPFMTSLREHGSVVRIRIGPTPAFVVTDPALTRKVLVTDSAHFVKGGKIIDALRMFFGDGLATVADGETHLRNRRLIQPMFNKAHIADRGAAMIGQVRDVVTAWPADVPRDVYADMNEVALSAFLVALFGANLPEHLEGEFVTLMPEIMKGAIRQTILPPWITRLPLPANRAHADRVAQLRTLIDQAIDHHADRSPGPAPSADTVSADARRCPHAAARTKDQGGLFTTLLTAEDPLTRQQLQDEAITLLTGAIETTGTTLAWTLYEITQSDEIQRRLREELTAACGDRPLRYDDIAQLPYARQVLQETIRKYGPAWMVTRTAARDIDLGGHRIPEGADIVWSPYLHQHDTRYFPDPDTFDPDRWTAERAPAARGSFLAFGDGRRKCIGENFAWAELQIILASILQTWPSFTLTSRPPRAQAVVTVKPDTLTMAYHPQAPSMSQTSTEQARPLQPLKPQPKQ
ncbi:MULTISPECIES: cytochrome P450 [unclassified Streptomyces]|uniref:cytochrome P450 n=1 Tax=unclassified Streptomyces TaxID=2593676 RepID=UPI002DD844BB|nr:MULTISPECIES: cytochrome P450 [unclassified Streptomyces]WSC34323.1 cytochrome P450 [Streptomyces sp. NBC_01763]WSC41738.1 cytochrome P450 [Streptomyces sp. NBC_01763]WSC51118.1 cytochrome P450 [Streptomyces sp. NBC_01761]WSC58404.1 cytochrome P450 [Streptomyces sp. NBC_01761]